MSSDIAKTYNMDEAYVIVGQGVGRLDLEKASKSQAFIEKAKQLGHLIDKVSVIKTTSFPGSST